MSEVLAMERGGYRVNLYVSKANDNYNGQTSLLILKVKDAGQSMNVARCAYPLINVSFFRGISFGWYQRAPLKHSDGYGRPLRGYEFAHALKTLGVKDAV